MTSNGILSGAFAAQGIDSGGHFVDTLVWGERGQCADCPDRPQRSVQLGARIRRRLEQQAAGANQPRDLAVHVQPQTERRPFS